MATTPLKLANHQTYVVLDLGCTRSIGSRKAIERIKKHAWYYGIMMEFCRCNKSFVFANSETETCMESCIIHFPTTPCSTKVDVIETCDVSILCSLPQRRNLGMTIEMVPMGDKITCPAYGLYSSPAEYSTMGHIVLDLTSRAYQPTTKSRERSGHPKRHVTFAMSEQKPAYPAHTKDMHGDEDDGPLAKPDHMVVSDDEDDQYLVQPASGKKPTEEKRYTAIDDGNLAPLVLPRPSPAVPVRRRKGPPVCQDPIATLEQNVSRDHFDFEQKAEGEALRNIFNRLFDERNLRDLNLKHYHMSTAQFQTRTTHLDIPGKFDDLYQHVVETCPFCNSIKPRPERSRVSGLRAEKFENLIFLNHGSAKIGDKTFGFLICFGWCHITFDSISM